MGGGSGPPPVWRDGGSPRRASPVRTGAAGCPARRPRDAGEGAARGGWYNRRHVTRRPIGVSAAAIPLALLAALLCVSVGVLVVAPAAAQEGDPAEAPAAEVPEPAIPVPDEDPAEPEPEWSYRFLVPATMLLGTVTVVGAIIMYFVRVTKNRYRVIR